MIESIDALNIKLTKFVHFSYRFIFHQEMSANMSDFLGHLSWSFFGGVLASAIMLCMNILAGRWMGPEEYGRYGLLSSLGLVFFVFMTAGVDFSSTHYIARGRLEEKKKVIQSSAWMIVVLIIFVSLLILPLSSAIGQYFLIDEKIIRIAILFGAVYAIRNILDSYVRGLHFFKYQALGKIGEAVVAVSTFFVLFHLFGKRGFLIYVQAMLVGYTFFIICAASYIWKYFGIAGSYSIKLLKYGSYAFWGALSGIILSSADKFLINHYLGDQKLGLYFAYNTASILVATQLIAVIVNVYFPYISKIKDKNHLLKKINKLAVRLFFPGISLFFVMTFLVISLFGRDYSVDLTMIFGFSLFSVMQIYFAMLFNLIGSIGQEGIRFTAVHGSFVIFVYLSLILIFRNVLTLQMVPFFGCLSLIYPICVGNYTLVKNYGK